MKKRKRSRARNTCHAQLTAEQVKWLDQLHAQYGLSKSYIVRALVNHAQTKTLEEWLFTQK